MKRALTSAAVAALGVTPLMAPAPAQAAQGYIDLTWTEGGAPVSITNDWFAMNSSAVPGDIDGRYMTVRNSGPTTGLLKVSLVEVKGFESTATGSQEAMTRSLRQIPLEEIEQKPFFKEVHAKWMSSFINGDRTFNKLIQEPNAAGEIPLGEVQIPAGQTAMMNFGYVYEDLSAGNYRKFNETDRYLRQVSYKIKITMSGETPVSPVPVQNLTLEITGKLLDKDGDGLADLGEKIEWTFIVKNTGTEEVTNLKIISSYLKAKGLQAKCEATTLAPGASTKCFVVTTVDKADMLRDYVVMDGYAEGTGVTTTKVISSLNSAAVAVDKKKAVTPPPGTTPQPPKGDPGTSTPPPGNPIDQGPGGGANPPAQQVPKPDPIDGNIDEPGTSAPPLTTPINNPAPAEEVPTMEQVITGKIDTGDMVASPKGALIGLGLLSMAGGLLIAFLAKRRRERASEA